MKSRWLLFSCSIILSLLVAESALQIYGFEPGEYALNRYFQKVDTLRLLSGYIADQDGVFKMSSKAGKTIEQRIENNNKEILPAESETIYELAPHIIELKNNPQKSPYRDKLNNYSLSDNSLDKAILNYLESPVNEAGFRSIAFEKYDSSKPSILLLT